jgi:hypothetical protein
MVYNCFVNIKKAKACKGSKKSREGRVPTGLLGESQPVSVTLPKRHLGPFGCGELVLGEKKARNLILSKN